MKSPLRYLLGAIILVGGVLTISYLQFRFDQSDLKHAVEAVRMNRPRQDSSETLEMKVSKQLGIPLDQILWDGEIESKWKGIIRVRAMDGQGKGDFLWKVDVVRFSIIPMNAQTENLLKQ